MTRRERLEDLGIITVKLEQLINEFEDRYIQYLGSKHSLDQFYTHIKNEESAEDLHRFLRWHHETLWEILSIARGDDGDEGL